ncbi:hypothetical protein Pse7367_2086 [Thalassoporum mexicanum PCC 7367]|uniref:hypothetical protein n=1 Tax=Thalassoporum mexicanum TaxID=3457544 RepID=UPI00029F89EE|nr:hypothetical protein [Pseudanabaena sp. PCC 7367]AFY70354.1 hypothetical protein Pse7367_2086 [Pseudanabaena sp. PCC 7367]
MSTPEPKNPLIRDGVAQPQRQVPALEPTYIQVDEKDLADALVFAHDLSDRIIYYNQNNQTDGNWRAFFERSAAVQIARISKTRPEIIREQYNRALEDLLKHWVFIPAISPALPATQLDKLEALFDIYAQSLDNLHTWYQSLTSGSIKATLKASVKGNLPTPLRSLYLLEQGLSQNRQACSWLRQPIYQKLAETFGQNVIPSIDQRLSPMTSGNHALALEIRRSLADLETAKAELDGIFQPIYQIYLQIIELAPQALSESLYAGQSLPPHLALYVAFWEVLKPARADLNRMTQRHLDFFYRNLLRFSEQPAQPDKAHLILRLEKFQQDHRLHSQTQFTAGTDATGADLHYTLNEEIVVNRAEVAEIKGLFLHHSDDREMLGVHASPIANSFDGAGVEFPRDQVLQAWLPFGDRTRPTAALGLAIASNIFLLKEGDRTLIFALTLSCPVPPGQSVVTITDITDRVVNPALRIEFSGKTKWISGTIRNLSFTPVNEATQEYTLEVTVELPINEEPIVPYHSNLPGGKLATKRPVARLLIQSPAEDTIFAEGEAQNNWYKQLYQAQLKAIALTVRVKGVHSLLLQNDIAILETTQPFLPFGSQPKVGANFYIGSSEAFQNSLTELKLCFELETAPPTDWAEIYAAYGIDYSFNPGKIAIQALRERQWHPMPAINGHLFSQPGENPRTYIIDLTEQTNDLNLHHFVVEQPENATFLQPWTYESQSGFLRFQLIGNDFHHADYPLVLARQVMATATQGIMEVTAIDIDAQAKARAEVASAQASLTAIVLTQTEAIAAVAQARAEFNQVKVEQAQARLATISVQVEAAQGRLAVARAAETASNQPVVKRRKRKAVPGAYYRRNDKSIIKATTDTVELDAMPMLPEEPYTPIIKSLQLDYTAIATQKDCQLFHLHPFDGVAILPNILSPPAAIAQPIPLLPQYTNEGELLIGLQNLEPLTTLSLLFQVVGETADTDLERTTVTWHYLKNNHWQRFDDHLILQDRSNGLIQSGIVKLAIPADISHEHTTILTPDLDWIKASVAERSRAIGHILSIQAQAAEVTFTDADNDPNHLASPLPADSITKFVDPPPEIKQVQQPYPSFGGQIKEQPTHFYTRVSEHLRHKGRAINIFDYEHLVLERFPEIYKVRCINHSHLNNEARLYEVSPGYVTLAVIPALSHKPNLDQLKPKVNINLLDEIEQYLRSLSSPWAHIQVINPQYEEIRVSFRVKFKSPFHANFSFYRHKLEQAIISFLSPWTIHGQAEIHFGGEIYRSSIIKFVEEQTYVDYVLNFQLYQGEEDLDRTKVAAKAAHSILVSVPFSGKNAGHRIMPVMLSQTDNEQMGEPPRNELGYAPLSQMTLGE